MRKKVDLRAFRGAFPRTLPVLAGYLAMGAAFGLLFQSVGYGPLWAAAAGILIYAGSGQFLAANLLAAGAGLPQMALLTFLLNFRHIFYGLSMITRYRGTGRRKGYLIFSLTDETYALLSAGAAAEGVEPGDYYLAVSLLNQCYWVAGCVIGSTVGALITFDTTGVDFAMTALFVVLAVDQWKSSAKHAPALTGLCCGFAALLAFGPEYFLIPALIAIAAVLLAMRRRLETPAQEALSPP